MPWISVVMRASMALKRRAQLVDGVFGAVDRHAIVGLAGLQDAPHRIAQIAQRLQRRSRQEHAADHADHQREAGAEHQHAPEIRQQLVAGFAGLADLQHRAAADVDRRDFEHRVAIARRAPATRSRWGRRAAPTDRMRPTFPAANRAARLRTDRPAARTAARAIPIAARSRWRAPAPAARRPGSASRIRAASTG